MKTEDGGSKAGKVVSKATGIRISSESEAAMKPRSLSCEGSTARESRRIEKKIDGNGFNGRFHVGHKAIRLRAVGTMTGRRYTGMNQKQANLPTGR